MFKVSPTEKSNKAQWGVESDSHNKLVQKTLGTSSLKKSLKWGLNARNLVYTAVYFVLALGILMVLGWCLEQVTHINWMDAFMPGPFSAALLFILSSLAAGALFINKPQITVPLTLCIVILSALKLFKCVQELNFGVGGIFIELIVAALVFLLLLQGMKALKKSLEADQALHQSNKYLEQAIAKAPMPVVIYEEGGRIHQYSESWHQNYRMQFKEKSMHEWLEESGVIDEKGQKPVTFAQLCHFSGVVQLMSGSGETLFWMIHTSELLTLASGQRLYMTMVNDITEIRETQIELERSNEDLDKFAYVASHDLKSPLRAIQSIAGWIMEDCESVMPSKSMDDFILLTERTKRMEKLLDALLQYSRIGSRDSKVSQIKVKELLSALMETLRVPEGFSIKVKGKMPVIEAPEVVLNLVFSNFISNALKHHDKKKGVIVISHEESINGYRFSVSDDGPGIELQYHRKIFQMFETLKPRDTIEGSGMGLAFVKKSVERYGGSVFIESEVGKGSTIGFTWPRYKTFKRLRANGQNMSFR